ncbi:hypothetical protein [uncultured Brevibacillus sp.]|uniref:hypothetical protein n=1 Tax=uncultured Brevibacillus sp. TaxID=169970 RepID=UPI002594E905|nr:hypothetical protein [uncultured Brevibacillus sp.]
MKEDDLLKQIDTCQLLVVALLDFVRHSNETLHLCATKRIFSSIQAIEKSLEDNVLGIRIENLFLSIQLMEQ